MKRVQRSGNRAGRLVLWIALALAPATAFSQATITPNYKDADIQQVIEAVGEVTGKNFIIDPRVKAQVTMVSSTPMSAEAFYEAFLSILQVYGFVAVPSGEVIKILPDANARQLPGWEGAAEKNRRADDIVTQVVMVRNVAAAQLVPILRPLIPQYGHLAAHPASNMLIISDRAANVERIKTIIRRIDQSSDEEYEVIPLIHASAAETVRVITALQQGSGADTTGQRTTVVADERTNSILVSGEKTNRLRLRTLIAHLDTPLEDGGDTRVRYLRYADSLDLATKLQAQYSGAGASEGGPPGTTTDISIWADEQTNALVITAPPKTMRSMMAVIDKIDIRRAQVLVEAIIVEVSTDKSRELGITWAVFNESSAAGATNFGLTPGILGLATGAGSEDGLDLTALGDGGTLIAGDIKDDGTSWAGLIKALEGDADTNIMATPSLVTMDNEEAEFNVGQEVPFRTGSFTNTGAAGGSVNPFETVEREQVGLTLKLTPQINEGDAVLLEIDQELSSLAGSVEGAADLVTNNRTVTTSVIVEDRAILVLSGLIQEEQIEREQRVPVLGSIPLLGRLFRSDKTEVRKKNLMIFIKPTILRDKVATAFETNEKYRFIRDLQIDAREGERKTFPDMEPPMLPELEELVPPPNTIDLRELEPEGPGENETAEPADEADAEEQTETVDG